MQQLRGTRKGGGVFAVLFYIGFMRRERQGQDMERVYSLSFCLDTKRNKKSRLMELFLNTTSPRFRHQTAALFGLLRRFGNLYYYKNFHRSFFGVTRQITFFVINLTEYLALVRVCNMV